VRSATKLIGRFTIVATGVAALAVLAAAALFEQPQANPKALSDCGNACHTAVKAKDYIFHPYQKRCAAIDNGHRSANHGGSGA